ncbi:cell wall-binding repeat-containing protein [Leifsonia sp. NPDC056665]|uniref:cell wall-binding repeat-containing protein n=1 Tax=Leifsonia sp. NPDC056665 TaxID=3345901 RepID=UPI0036B88FE5
MKTPHRITLAAAVLALAAGLAVAPPAAAASGQVVHGTISLGDASHPAAAGEARVSLVGTNLDTSVVTVGGPVLTDASGAYSLTAPIPNPNEHIELHVEYLGTGGYQSVYGNRAKFVGLPGEGENLSLLPGADITFDQTLPLPTTITGRIVTTANAAAPAGSVVAARSDTYQWFSAHNDQAPAVTTLADGTYTISGLLPGTYSVSYDSSGSYWNGTAWAYRDTATRPFAVNTAGGSAAAADQVAYGLAQISAGFQCPRCSNTAGPSVGDSQLIQVEPDGSETVVLRMPQYLGVSGVSGASGSYSFPAFPGTYRVMEYIGGQPEAGVFWSDPITVGEYDSVSPTTTLSLPATTRLAGADRYATSATISANTLSSSSRYDPGVGTVFIASGQNFPDALSAVPVAGSLGAPLLLVPQGFVPDTISAELTRLRPGRIVIVGGTATVSDSVAQSLTQFVASPADVVRVAGADRFATSRALTEFGFPTGSKTLLLASGWTFPDALSAGAAAASKHAGVLLVDGRGSSPDAATLAELQRSGVTNVEIVGGPAAISSGFEAGLSAIPGLTVTRVSGADRFATSVAITADAFPGLNSVQSNAVGGLHVHDTAVIASGANFPDALAGAALAGRMGAPLLIAGQGCLPPDALSAAEYLGVTTAVLIGGTAALSTPLDTLTTCR